MKTRAWITLGAGALLAGSCYALLVPNEQDAFRDRLPWSERFPEIREAQTALTAAREAAIRAERFWEVAHSVAVAEALPVTRARFSLSAARGIPAAAVARIEAQARAELAALGREPAQPIVVRLVVDSVRERVGYRRVVIAPAGASDPCVVVLRIGAPYVERAAGWATNDQLLGTCGFYALYGMPGTGMQAWLERTGAQSAATVRFVPEEPGRQGPMKTDVSMVLRAPTAVACLAKRNVACAQIFDGRFDAGIEREVTWWMAPDVETRAAFPRVWTYSSWEASGFPGTQLAGVREQLGDERFAPIWRSPEEPSAAYLRSEGRPLEDWVRENISRWLAPYYPGPMVRVIPLLLTLLLTAALAWWGIRRTARTMS